MEPLENFEDRYLDVLQNIESMITAVYRNNPTMNDWDAQDAVVGLIRTYQAESEGHEPPTLRLRPNGQMAFDAAREACEFRLGRASGRKSSVPALSLDEILACLKRIRRSIEKWQKQGGRTTYLDFVSQHT